MGTGSGMSQDTPRWRRWIAGALLGTLPVLAVVIPVLDLVVGDGGAAVESQHIPGTHGFPHNHLICIQQQANQWAPSPCDPTPSVGDAYLIPGPPDSDHPPFATPITLPRPRAPPTA